MSRLGSFFTSPGKRRVPISTLVTGAVGLVIIVVLVVLLVTNGASSSQTTSSRLLTAAATTSSASSATPTSATPTSAPPAANQSTNAAAEQSFDSPEAAIKSFVSAIANSDFAAAEQAFAVNEYAQKFDFIGYADWIKALEPLTMLAPSKYTMYQDMNEAAARGELARATKMFIYSFFVTKGMDSSSGGLFVAANEDDVTQFVKAVDPSGLRSLQIVKIGVPWSAESSSDVVQKMQDKLHTEAGLYGADDMTERVVDYNLNGQYFEGGFRLLKYGNDWKILTLYSSLAAQSGTGAVTKVTQ